MALVEIGAVGIVSTNTKNSTATYPIMDDNKTVKNFYPLQIGFTIQFDPYGVVFPNKGTMTYNNLDDNKTVKNFYYMISPTYVFWS